MRRRHRHPGVVSVPHRRPTEPTGRALSRTRHRTPLRLDWVYLRVPSSIAIDELSDRAPPRKHRRQPPSRQRQNASAVNRALGVASARTIGPHGARTSSSSEVCRPPPLRRTSPPKSTPLHCDRGRCHTPPLSSPSRRAVREEERWDDLDAFMPWLPPSASVPVLLSRGNVGSWPPPRRNISALGRSGRDRYHRPWRGRGGPPGVHHRHIGLGLIGRADHRGPPSL